MRAQSLLVRDVAVHNAVTVRPEESISECAKRMHAEHVGCLIVVEQTDGIQFPLGMLTDRDIAIEVVAFGLDPRAMTAGDVMSERPAVIEEAYTSVLLVEGWSCQRDKSGHLVARRHQ